MAKLDYSEWVSFSLTLTELAEVPDETVDRMLSAQCEVVAKAQREEAAKLGMEYDPKNHNARETSATNSLPGQKRSYTTGATARAVSVGKMKKKRTGREKYVYFKGDRPKRTPNSKPIPAKEVAFLNEFGSRNINQRNWIDKANRRSANEAAEAGEKVYDDWLRGLSY